MEKTEAKNIYVSPVLNAFFIAEIANEKDGGDSPSTFDSALNSLIQMPEDIFKNINPEMKGVFKKGDYENAEKELKKLMSDLGGGAPLEKYTTCPQVSWFISYPPPDVNEIKLWKMETSLSAMADTSNYLNEGISR